MLNSTDEKIASVRRVHHFVERQHWSATCENAFKAPKFAVATEILRRVAVTDSLVRRSA